MRTCFIVCPIGSVDSPQRKRSDIVLKHIIEPICNELKFKVIRVDQINAVDKIDITIIEHLTNSDLVIADITEHNPNAFYELGYRHALGKPLIPIKDEDTFIPFDIANVRTITYATNDLEKADEARKRLKQTILSFEINDNGSVEDKYENHQSMQNQSIIPFLLDIQDSIDELKELINARNNDEFEHTIDLVIGQIQKNSSSKPEDKAMELLLGKAFENPEQMEGLIKVAQKYNNNPPTKRMSTRYSRK